MFEPKTDESAYWLELLVDSGKVDQAQAEALIREANELLAITVASINTAKRKAGQ